MKVQFEELFCIVFFGNYELGKFAMVVEKIFFITPLIENCFRM